MKLLKNRHKNFINSEEIDFTNNSKAKNTKKTIKRNNNFYNKILILIVILFIIILLCIIIILVQLKIIINNQKRFPSNNSKTMLINNENTFTEIQKKDNNENSQIDFSNTPIEEIDLNILKPIQSKILGIVELQHYEQKFFNGILRAIKPKKIVEIGVSRGGSSIIILNAIKDIEGAKLYSIDKSRKWYRNSDKDTGYFVKENFPELMNKWELNVGGITSEFIEKIGGDIDLVFIDTVHRTPGEMLDWLQVLPFLKEEAFVVFHDTFFMYMLGNYKQKINCSNNQLLTYIRGELILPSYGNSIFSRNIGALKLTKDQKKYYKQYFLALGTQWEYMPEEKDLIKMREYFMKYYGEKYVEIYDDAVNKNKKHLNKY